MIRIRKASERGHADYGWLNTYRTFSFSTYYDPEHNGFRSLLVMNEDRVQPGRGYLTKLKTGEGVTHVLPANRHAWLQVLRGKVTVNGVALGTSDGAAISDEAELDIRSDGPSELMLFDLP